MSEVNELIEALLPEQQAAIKVIKIALDCYNSYDGSGLFIGSSRYDVLTARVEIAAIQSRNLFQFWSALQRRMMWGITPKMMDKKIALVLQQENPLAVLQKLATETVLIVMIARMLHSDDKAAAKLLAKDFKDDELPEFAK